MMRLSLLKVIVWVGGITVFLTLIFRKNIPIVVYQPGKVGSSSIVKSLRANDANAFQVHYATSSGIKRLLCEYKEIGTLIPPLHLLNGYALSLLAKYGIAFKTVVLFRDPAKRNISAFFQNQFDRFEKFGDPSQKNLLEEFINSYPHALPDRWLCEEFCPFMGIDPNEVITEILASDTLTQQKGNILFLTVESQNRSISKKLSSFAIPNIDISLFRENDAKQKSYYTEYQHVLKQLEENNYFELARSLNPLTTFINKAL